MSLVDIKISCEKFENSEYPKLFCYEVKLRLYNREYPCLLKVELNNSLEENNKVCEVLEGALKQLFDIALYDFCKDSSRDLLPKDKFISGE